MLSVVLRGIKMKEISVIIPAFNCGKYLPCAIDSVMKQGIDLEIILVDDASTDNTEQVVQKLKKKSQYPICYIKNFKNIGVSASRNKGVQYAQAGYIAYLDADDWWESEKLKKQIRKLKESGGILCYTGRELFREDGSKTGRKIAVPPRVDLKKLLYTNYIPCSSVVLKTEVAKEFPMEHDEVHEDYLTWLRIVKKYGCVYGINEPLLKSRLTKNGKSRKKRRSIIMTYGVYRCFGIGRKKAVWYTGNHLIRSLLRYQTGRR